MLFKDRVEAGLHLARELTAYASRSDVLVLALPRGGVPVGYEVARALNAPLDVLVVRKLGLPGQEELAMGAIASGGVRVLNEDVVQYIGVSDEVIEKVAVSEREELERRDRSYRGERPPPNIAGQTVILVDDGLATGSTMKAAARAVRAQKPAKLVVAVPVSAQSTCRELRDEVDEIICDMMPEPFQAVGLWYEDFPQMTDEEVRELLEQARSERASAASAKR